ncbi:hypothetical protein DSM112329_04916 [Paraconexibacter sp. AEG42_29]|uniref:Class I SAM-dependent methyltransferase n=1 Tax=Paraconexibacter sp. AEG42_29 TaxID=2997339 RepID=A0AAU7B1X7_9ACTN
MSIGDLFDDPVWQMALGERAAIEGILSALQPQLAIEVGTAEGACLGRIAQHAQEVHSFDLVTPQLDLPDHVTLHTGDSHQLLPAFLAELAEAGRSVDFALVDGDHSSEGVRRDVEALLASPAVTDTIIITHDTGNERVRAGLDAVPYGAYPKVAHVDLDFVPGHLGQDRFPGELWYGLGLIVVDAAQPAYGSGAAVQTDRHHGGALLSVARDVLGGRPPEGPSGHDPRARQLSDAYAHIDALEARLAELAAGDERLAAAESEAAHHQALVADLMTSVSWRVTAPLRAAKRTLSRS